MNSKAKSVAEYLKELPLERKTAISAIRNAMKAAMPKGYEEAMNWGMICYQVPLSHYSATYNGQPLMYAAIASQKNHMAVYLNCLYVKPGLTESFEHDYRATGKKLDMGKSCVRFKKLEDLPLNVITDYVSKVTPSELIAADQKVHGN